MRSAAVLLLTALAVLHLIGFGAPVPAQATSEQERVREAVQAGEILPLSTVLDRVRRQVKGRVLDARVRGGGSRPWLYLVKMLSPDNRVVVVTADARTGRVLNVQGGR